MATEEHGIFQFTEFSDDLFETQEKKIRHFIDKSYIPDESVHGSFVTHHEATQVLFDTKFGPQQLQNALEWAYYRKQYRECLDMCLKWIELNQNCKLEKQYKMGEIYEIACRSSLKLKDLDSALKFAELVLQSNGKEPGVMFLVAQVFTLSAKYTESTELLVKYLDYRRNDYLAYVELSIIFEKLSETYPEFKNWVYFSLSLAIYLVERSPRPDTEYSKKHTEQELTRLKSRLSNHTVVASVDHAVLAKLNLSQSACDYLLNKIYDNRTNIETESQNKGI
ncbi:hypothetical protein HDV01_006206 [Terramyces sp. JEL0728]|nr:hypothetical protein HDV01_006206 [Terramyces sp. JEL0728]